MKKKLRLRQVIAMLLTVVMLCNTVTMDIFATGTNDTETIKAIEAAEAADHDDTGDGSGTSESKVSTPAVIGEDTSKREANVKYFLNEDFSYTAAIYSGAVHYLDNGQWKDIDNGLKSVTLDGDSTYVENKANRMKVRFAQDTQKDRLIDIEIDGYQLSWGMDTGERTAQRRLAENVLDIRSKQAAVTDEINAADVEDPEQPADTEDDERLAESESDADNAAESAERDLGNGTQASESDEGNAAETTESDPENGTQIAESEAGTEAETEAATLESRETMANQSSVSDRDSETDTSLAPVDNEPVGENTTATLITENPDAAKMAAEGDTEGLKALEEASRVSSAASGNAGASGSTAISGNSASSAALVPGIASSNTSLSDAAGNSSRIFQKAQGILPEKQEGYKTTNSVNEETLNDDHF